MDQPIKKIVILGSGSAGLLVALAMRKKHPDLPIVIVRSKNIPIIGVGEGSTTPVTTFLHDFLAVDPKALFQIARPTWKLGLKFLWGPRKVFYYPFHKSADLRMSGLSRQMGFYAGESLDYLDPCSALMAHDRVFPRNANGTPDMMGRHFAYHFENEHFVEFLEGVAAASGVITIEDKVVDVRRDGQVISSLVMESGRTESADLFIDCSGFVSALLGKVMGEPFVSYKSSLFCERAIVGGWNREEEPIKPYTTAETMNAGWSWQIEHENRINRGYVYCTDFISDSDAEREFREKNPKLGTTRVVNFVSGRYARTWVGNVVGIGNSAAFVEPLEATALGSICMQAQLLSESLVESDRRIIPIHVSFYNDRVARNTDSIRQFLAVHYKFNTLLDTPFWKVAREKTDLAGAERIVEYYRATGPGDYWQYSALDIFDLATTTGFLQMLLGQDVPHRARVGPTSAEKKVLAEIFAKHRNIGMNGFTIKEMLQLVRDPRVSWN